MNFLIYILTSLKVLFVFFALPHLSQPSMYSDIVNVFHEKGHQVYPMAPTRNGEKKSFVSTEKGINVLRIKTKDVFSKNLIQKGIANVLLPYQFKNAFVKYWKETSPDLIIVATPSVMFADFVAFAKRRTHAKVLLLQKDIFPQNAVDLGFMKKESFIYKFFKKHEIRLLKTADKIGCTSEGNKSYLLKHYPYLKKENLGVVYNSTKLLDKDFDKSTIKDKYDIAGKFVVVFGGNMGKPQQLENVLKLARSTSVYKNVIFLIIGSGTEVDALRREAQSMELSNILFVDKVPRKDYFNLLANCNLGLISLHQDFTVPNTPMKLNDYLNAGLPVLASIDRSNDLGTILVENNIGKFAFADSPDKLFERFNEFYLNQEECKKIGRNGYEFCTKYLSIEKCYQTITELLNDAQVIRR